MKITEINIYKKGATKTFKGFASVTFDDTFCVTGIRIVKGKKGLFISMPSREYDGEYYDICFPTTKEFRKKLNDKIIEAYENADDEDEKPSKKSKKTKKSKDDDDDDDDDDDELPF